MNKTASTMTAEYGQWTLNIEEYLEKSRSIKIR